MGVNSRTNRGLRLKKTTVSRIIQCSVQAMQSGLTSIKLLIAYKNPLNSAVVQFAILPIILNFFMLTVVGQSYADGDVTTARHLYRASYGVSIAGIVVGLILIVTIIAVVATGVSSSYPSYSSCGSSSSCRYYYYDSYGCKQCCYALSSSCFYNSG